MVKIRLTGKLRPVRGASFTLTILVVWNDDIFQMVEVISRIVKREPAAVDLHRFRFTDKTPEFQVPD